MVGLMAQMPCLSSPGAWEEAESPVRALDVINRTQPWPPTFLSLWEQLPLQHTWSIVSSSLSLFWWLHTLIRSSCPALNPGSQWGQGHQKRDWEQKWEVQADEQLGPHQLWAGWVGWNQVRPTGFCHTENTYDRKSNKFTFQVTSCLLFDLASITPLVSLLVSWDRLKWTVGVRAASSATIKKTKCNLMEIDRLLLHPNKTYALRKQLLVLILEKGISSIPPRAYRWVTGEWGCQSLPA